MIKFENKSTVGRPNQIVVKQFIRIGSSHSKYKKNGNNSYMVEKGWISEHPEGNFRYYEPITNELNSSLSSSNLEELKKQIKQHLERMV